MIFDTSAIIAIILREPTHTKLVEKILTDTGRLAIGGPTLVETGIVLSARTGHHGRTLLSRFVEETALEVVPVGADHWGVAVDAFVRYGKGRHPAALNFGDCLSYAVAKIAGEPLLCVGRDFAATDIELALPETETHDVT